MPANIQIQYSYFLIALASSYIIILFCWWQYSPRKGWKYQRSNQKLEIEYKDQKTKGQTIIYKTLHRKEQI